ncbi:hypothetical protein [Methylobacterium sp. GC_Met_2]|uniref:hypothetical protein n=1 Tax=Methylobacterium sp. GC_Met_2 TaxID=2937376 RepID=UPI00226BADFF|nr:hypothetical protein [Methylobacterium sp. GC_Met_2]
MAIIPRGLGFTQSETRLISLAERTFLDLWSYGNTYIDKKQHESGSGKEFCDLLVVCGDDIIIFSDKLIQWPVAIDINLAWSRWYKRAIGNSVKQINGAIRWIEKFPDRIFLDAACTIKLPIKLPPASRRRIHGVVISNGSNEACRKHFDDVSGTFIVNAFAKGDDHTNTNSRHYMPFSVGDANPDGAFVHVFDTLGFETICKELDTITDFTNYINKRERFIRNGQLAMAAGEEDLLAHYLSYTKRNGEHDFLIGNSKAIPRKTKLVIEGGKYDHLKAIPAFQHRRLANRISYAWDDLVSLFTKHIIGGTNVAIYENQPLGTFGEPALRLMALENRTRRRMLGYHLVQAHKSAVESGQDRFTRTLMPLDYGSGANVAYIILFLTYKPEKFQSDGGYDTYRRLRARYLEALCFSVSYEYRRLTHVVAIGFDGPTPSGIGSTSSEDIVAIEPPDWTEDAIKFVMEERQALNIKSPKELENKRSTVSEFPTREYVETSSMSRQERRALQRKNRKNNDFSRNPT